MAVKASASITVAHERDIQSTTRFYKIAPSTSPPTAPTEKQGEAYINSGTVPSGWSKAEPAYDGTSTNSLYTCDLTGFTDGNVSWSVVSKSSSYEAAKQAYNEAQNAKAYADGLADDLEAQIPTKVSDLTNDANYVANTAALSRTQRIYYRSDSSALPNPPTENNKGKWFEPTQSDTGYNTWSRDIVPLIGGFPYLFMCDQTQTAAQYVAGNECTNSSVMRDDSNSVIDGGSITTGRINANYIDAASLQIGTGQVDGLGEFMSLMTFKGGVLRIAKPGSRFAVELSDEGLFFKQNDTAVSYINMNRLYIPYAVVLDQMMIGKEENNSLWAWTSEEDGSLTLKWIGGNN